MKDESELSYLSAFYYIAAVLFILTGVFAAPSHSWGMAAAYFSGRFSLVTASWPQKSRNDVVSH